MRVNIVNKRDYYRSREIKIKWEKIQAIDWILLRDSGAVTKHMKENK